MLKFLIILGGGKFFITYIINAPKHLYELLYNYITIRPFVEYFGTKIWNIDPYKYCKHFLLVLYFIRIFVCFIFLMDIFIFHKFNYFYKSLILLLIPLLINVFLFIIQDISKKNKKYIEEEFLGIEVNETNDGFYADPKDKYLETMTDQQLNSLSNTWVAYLANCMFTDKIELYDSFYKKYINVFCYGLYVLGWGYILYTIFYK